ncbi:MAG: FMN-binding protein, partial [Clostridia bacterium]|nr:FMN-binding protein [Clostridia bacterium]
IKAANETAGLGLKAEEPEFAAQFIGKVAPFAYGDGIDAIASATMTSNAVIEALNSLFPADEPEASAEDEVSEPETTDALIATAMGFAGNVEVTATLNENGSIATLTIKAANETAGLGLKAEEPEFAAQFIGKTAPFAYGDGIDAIASATMTSNAVLEALNSLFEE